MCDFKMFINLERNVFLYIIVLVLWVREKYVFWLVENWSYYCNIEILIFKMVVVFFFDVFDLKLIKINCIWLDNYCFN